jgi:hypothetical protein
LAGDQDQSNAVDQDERTFEVVKLRIAFLQHITTLSGAATLIILAIMQRTEDPFVVRDLATIIVVTYAFTAVFSVLGIVSVINMLQRADLYPRPDTGRYITVIASGSFAAGTMLVAIISTGVPPVRFIFTAAVFAAVLAAIFRATRLLSKEPGTNGEDQDPDASPRP